MYEDEESDVSQGYGNAQDLMPQDPAAQGGDGGGGDPIMAGVQAFMETQDPQIAVEVVIMLAEQMGLSAPAPAPGGGGGMGGAPMGAPPMGGGAPMGAPMGLNGMVVRPILYR